MIKEVTVCDICERPVKIDKSNQVVFQYYAMVAHFSISERPNMDRADQDILRLEPRSSRSDGGPAVVCKECLEHLYPIIQHMKILLDNRGKIHRDLLVEMLKGATPGGYEPQFD